MISEHSRQTVPRLPNTSSADELPNNPIKTAGQKTRKSQGRDLRTIEYFRLIGGSISLKPALRDRRPVGQGQPFMIFEAYDMILSYDGQIVL